MIEIATTNLKPGMKFDAPVYIDEKNILVPPGIPIKAKDIERLKRWEIASVRTNGNEIKGESEQAAVSPALLFEMEPEDKQCLDVYYHSLTKLKEVFIDIRKQNKITHDTIDRIVNDLYQHVKEHKNKMIQLVLQSEKHADDLTTNSVNCTIIAIVIGLILKTISHRILLLASGALLHDVGMLRIPEEIVNKKEDLTEKELNLIKTHPIYSYQIISKELKYADEIAQIGLYHQERWDGKGYPKQLNKENIPLFARIVAVADSYVAMVKERPYRGHMIGYDAIKTIIRDNFKRFDPNVVKAFLKGMGIYPIGSIVLLNNGAIARVNEINSNAPLRPKIDIIIDEHGDKLQESKSMDLLRSGDLFIVRAVDKKVLQV
ncbi:MAG: HD-GYP domain-containing protein [Spirochaetales bacterium]|nr:HD-GYP domain-containing protein [Spirochaetales bacterium]